MAEEWKKAARESDLQPGRPIAVSLEDQEIYLVRLGDSICACGNKCSHYGGPLTEGVLEDGVIVCPWHNAHFEAATGRMLKGPALSDLPTWEVKVRDGDVLPRATGPAEIPMPAGEDPRTFLIVGAGAAGNAAAEMLRRQGFAGRILLLTPEPDLPYDRTMLSKGYLAGEAKKSWVRLRKPSFYERLRIEILTGRKAAGLDPGRRRVTLDDGQVLEADRILLATGGLPRTLDIPGAGLPGVFLLRSFADCNAIIEAAGTARRAVLLGASFIGLEVAASLTTRGLEVHVAAPEEIPMARVFGERIGRRIQGLHEERGVRFHLGNLPRRITRGGEGLEVELSGGERIATDLVVVGVGIEPAVGFLESSGLVAGGAVPVDGRLETPAAGVFAAGDIALVPDERTGRPVRVEHWVVAERQGQHAARAMLGEEEPYRDVPFFWTLQFGSSFKYVGQATRFDRIAYRGDVEAGNFLAGFYENGRLQAAACLGLARPLIWLGKILTRGGNVTPGQLEDPAFDLSEVS